MLVVDDHPLFRDGILAAAIITIGAADGVKNYTLLYLVGGALALVGAALIIFVALIVYAILIQPDVSAA